MIRHPRRIAAIALACLAGISSYASIQITGLREVGDAEARALIKEQIAQVEKNRGSRPLADDASFFLERELRRKGYQEADVQWRFDEATRGITLVVDEGAGQKLGEITFSGNVAEVAEEDLRALVRRATANRNQKTILQKKEPLAFVETDIASGLADVSQLYRSLGYWDAKTAPLSKSLSSHDGLNDIHVQIDAGPLHHFRAFKLEGATGPQTSSIQAELAKLVGKPCTTDEVSKARAAVSEFYSQRGYYHHEISVTPTDHGSEITLTFAITAGQPFEVASLSVEGNRRVRSEFLKQRFKPLVGKPYSPAAADKIYRELLGIGLFSRISLNPEEIPGTPNAVDLKIIVEEAKARSVGVYGGYGTYDGAILGFIFRENNVFGRGRQFKSTAEYTQRGLRGEFDYSDKWFRDSPFFFNTKLFALSEEREGYTKFEYGGRIELGREIGEHYSVTAFATLGHTEISKAELEAADLGLQNYRIGSIGLAHSWDMRDHPVLPSRGFIFDNTIEYASSALASDVEFVRGTIRFSSYIPITKRTQLSLGARSGFIMPTGDSDQLPIDLRFFSGGSTSVRSFSEKHLGASDRRGYPLGGEFYNTFNAEYTVPIYGGLKAAVFADAGNLIRDLDNASLNGMHYALGTGLRYELPTGPIRLDYGWNMNRGQREPSGTFHISIGFAF